MAGTPIDPYSTETANQALFEIKAHGHASDVVWNPVTRRMELVYDEQAVTSTSNPGAVKLANQEHVDEQNEAQSH
jgi:hypothetical protein